MSSTVSWDDVRGSGTAAQRRRRSRADNEEKGALTEEKKIRVTSGNRRVASQKRLQAALQRINRRHCSTVLNFLTPELYIDRGRLFIMEAGRIFFCMSRACTICTCNVQRQKSQQKSLNIS